MEDESSAATIDAFFVINETVDEMLPERVVDLNLSGAKQGTEEDAFSHHSFNIQKQHKPRKGRLKEIHLSFNIPEA